MDHKELKNVRVKSFDDAAKGGDAKYASSIRHDYKPAKTNWQWKVSGSKSALMARKRFSLYNFERGVEVVAGGQSQSNTRMKKRWRWWWCWRKGGGSAGSLQGNNLLAMP